MEDIKILEEMEFWEGCETTIDGKWCKAFENLLTKYKQLEQENNNFKEASIINDSLYKEVCNKNKELKKTVKSVLLEIG